MLRCGGGNRLQAARFDTNGLNVGAPQRGARTGLVPHNRPLEGGPRALFGMAAPLLWDRRWTQRRARARAGVRQRRGFRQYAIAFGGKLLGSDSVWDDQGLGVEVHVTDQGSDTPPSHVAFVNGIRCKGTLLDAVVRQLCAPLCDKYGALGPRAGCTPPSWRPSPCAPACATLPEVLHMAPRAVLVLDIDGTITTAEEGDLRALRREAKRLGVPIHINTRHATRLTATGTRRP
jgi:hypothetical protein